MNPCAVDEAAQDVSFWGRGQKAKTLRKCPSVKKGETGFGGMRRNEELNCFKNGRNKVTSPHLFLDVCFPPAILFNQFVNLLTNRNTTVLKCRNCRFCSSDRRPLCSSSPFLNSGLQLLASCFYFFFFLPVLVSGFDTAALHSCWRHLHEKHWIGFILRKGL